MRSWLCRSRSANAGVQLPRRSLSLPHPTRLSVDNPLAACFACCSRMAMWNQSAIGVLATRLGQNRPQTGTTVGERGELECRAARPTVSRLRQITTQRSSVSALRDGAEYLPPPPDVSTLPTRTSRCRSPSRRPRMNVESKVTVIADAPAAGLILAASHSCSPDLSVGLATSLGSDRSDRQEVLQQARGDAIWKQSRNMCSQLVEFRGGSAI